MSDKVSSIRHAPQSRFLVIYEDYINLCKAAGIEPADAGAGILRVFERWTDSKLAQREVESERAALHTKHGHDYQRGDDLWIWLPQNNLKKHELFDMFGERSVASALKAIVERGYLETRNNPKHAWDRTLQYRLNTVLVQKHLDHLQNSGLPLPQKDTIVEGETQDSKAQKATNNTTVVKQESLQEKAVDADASTDSDYANFLKDLHAPKPTVKRPAGAMPNPNHGDLLTTNQPAEPIAPPEFDMLVTAVTATLKQYGGGAEVFAKMLMGMKGRGEFNTYRMDIPVTATELQDWALWYRRDNPGLNVPTTPMKLTSSILAFRDQLENRTAVRNSALELAPESPTTTAADRAAIREAIAARRVGGKP